MNTEEIKDQKEPRRCSRRHLWKFPFFIAAIVLIKSAVVMVLWNALIPDLFHGPELAYLQALGITVLAKLLVGHHGHRGPFGRFGGGHHRGHEWRRKWSSMTPEEREKMRDEMRKRFERE